MICGSTCTFWVLLLVVHNFSVRWLGAGMAEHCDMNREKNVRAVC